MDNHGIIVASWHLSGGVQDLNLTQPTTPPNWASRAVMESRNCSWPWPFPVDESIHSESQQFESMVPSLHYSSPVSIPIGWWIAAHQCFQNMFSIKYLTFFPSNIWQYSDGTAYPLSRSCGVHCPTCRNHLPPKKHIKAKRSIKRIKIYKPLKGSNISKVLISIIFDHVLHH